MGAVNARDNDRITNYAIIAGNSNDAFAISWIGLLTTANTIDHESIPTYNLTVEVADGSGNTASNTVTVNIANIVLPPNVNTSKAITTSENSMIPVTESILRGNLTELGDSSDNSVQISEYGFIYSTTAFSENNLVMGGVGVEKTNLGVRNAIGQFSNRFTGLEECRTYYYRAYAVNDIDTNLGQIRSFSPGRQHQTFILSDATNDEQRSFICPYGTHTYNVPLSHERAYNLTIDSADNVWEDLSIFESTTTNELYIQAGPSSFSIGGNSLASITNVTITFSGAENGRRYLVLPLVTTNHRLVFDNNSAMGESYTLLTLEEETNTSGMPIGRLLIDETPIGFFSNNEPEFYWVHLPPNMPNLDGALTGIVSGNFCGFTRNNYTGLIYSDSDPLNNYEGTQVIGRHAIIRIYNNNSNWDYQGCQFKFRTR